MVHNFGDRWGGGKEFRGVRINAVLESEKDSARARVCVCMRVAKRKWQILARLGAGECNKDYEEHEPNSKK